MPEKTKPPGVIRADEAYTLDELANRLGLGRAAIREARRRGLPIRTVGRRRFILGSDVLAFIAKQEPT